MRQTAEVEAARRAASASAVIGISAAAATALVGFVLADVYRPTSPGLVSADLSDTLRQSGRWSDWHRLLSTTLVVVAAVNLALVAAFVARAQGSVSRKGLLIAVAVVTLGMSVATAITTPLVQWDQLALLAVTVGTDVDGYWHAAFGDGVQFVLIGSTEVAQGDYAVALVAHMAAPVVSAVGFAVAAAVIRAGRASPADGGLRT